MAWPGYSRPASSICACFGIHPSILANLFGYTPHDTHRHFMDGRAPIGGPFNAQAKYWSIRNWAAAQVRQGSRRFETLSSISIPVCRNMRSGGGGDHGQRHAARSVNTVRNCETHAPDARAWPCACLRCAAGDSTAHQRSRDSETHTAQPDIATFDTLLAYPRPMPCQRRALVGD